MVTTRSDVSSCASCFKGRIHWSNRFPFLAGSVPLAVGLGFAGVLTIDTTLHSLMGLIVVLAGFWVGEWLRGHVQQESFRRIVLWAFLIMGGRLIAIGLL